ncbi:hypothetical protein HDU96_006702 [Phlyctochytrium bullatum]|nr:hypothetical protein HDU96_006702 [Phlyctochytrium bullatum]
MHANGFKLRERGFQLLYKTNVPRQVGLAGSSALITALLKALIKFHKHDDDDQKFPPHIRANLALSAERDQLNIAAGQQDRVIQAYGGLVFMNFDRSLMETRGYGIYESLPLDLLPSGLWMVQDRYGRKLEGSKGDDMKRFYRLEDDNSDIAAARTDLPVSKENGLMTSTLCNDYREASVDDRLSEEDSYSDPEQGSRLIRGELFVESSDEEEEEIVASDAESEAEEEAGIKNIEEIITEIRLLAVHQREDSLQ